MEGVGKRQFGNIAWYSNWNVLFGMHFDEFTISQECVASEWKEVSSLSFFMDNRHISHAGGASVTGSGKVRIELDDIEAFK